MYNIIVCDDERDIVSALEIYLTAEGYHVLRAEKTAGRLWHWPTARMPT